MHTRYDWISGRTCVDSSPDGIHVRVAECDTPLGQLKRCVLKMAQAKFFLAMQHDYMFRIEPDTI